MKMRCFLSILALMTFPLGATAAVTITGVDEGPVSQMPGSSTDYTFTGTSTGDLTDFTVSYPELTYPGNPAIYSAIETPAGGSPVLTGIAYDTVNSLTPINLATYTLGNSATFNYADFNVFVLYSNADVPTFENDNPEYDPAGNAQSRDASISLGAGSGATGLSATLVPVLDDNTNLSMGRVVEFNVQGLASGEQFTIAASGTATTLREYIGAVSIESAPEPGTWAMLVAGFSMLFFLRQLRSRNI